MEKDQKIAILVKDINFIGGAETVAINLYKQLKKAGYNVVLVSLFTQASTIDKIADLEIVHLNIEKPNRRFKIIWVIAKFFFINKVHPFFQKYDVVIGNNIYYYVCYPKKNVHYKQIALHHMHYYENLYAIKNPIQYFLKKHIDLLLRDYAYRRLDKLVVLTKQAEGLFIKKGFQNTITIPNAIIISDNQKQSKKNKIIQFCFVGRYEEGKGIKYLLDIWKAISTKYDHVALNMYGFGNLETYMHDRILKENIKHININTPTNNVNKIFVESDITLFTSLHEGFPMVVLESMNMGTMVVSFDCLSGPSEIIKDKEDGFLVKLYDVQDFIHKLSFLIENPQEINKMGKQAQKNITRYSWRNVILQWEDILNKI